jgi:hypothetical protein
MGQSRIWQEQGLSVAPITSERVTDLLSSTFKAYLKVGQVIGKQWINGW